MGGLRISTRISWGQDAPGPGVGAVRDCDRSTNFEVTPMPSVPRSLRSVPRLLVLATVAGAAGAGLVSALASLAGTVPAVIAASAMLGAVAGAVAFFGFGARRRLGRMGKLSRDIEHVRARLAELPTRDQVVSLVQSTVFDARNRLHADVNRLAVSIGNDTKQLEALLNLHSMIPVRGPLPASRGWAASPDLLLAYVGDILARRPRLVVECGSGLSTLWAALALDTAGGPGRVVALEHDERFLSATAATLRAHGVAHRADVRLAPIEQVKVGQEQWPWYATSRIEDLHEIDLLFVDGPMVNLGPQSRYPALPLLRDRLNPGAVILLDDANRAEERETLEHWCADWPELSSEMLKFEKGAARIRVPG
jgi:Methyltransferase domain